MPGDPQNPEPGELVIDASIMQGYIVDLPEGGKAGLRPEQPGVAPVMAEIRANQPQWGPRAGVTEFDFQALTDADARIAVCDRFVPAIRKLLELVLETRCVEVDKRERLINSIAESAERRDKLPDNGGVAARYQLTREYRSAPGYKSAKTRKKNAQEKAEAEKAKAQASGAPPPPENGSGDPAP